MTKRIMVEKGYTILDRYIELEESEELCVKCGGTGSYRAYFGPPGGWNGRMTCPDCGGCGKRLRCTNCGKLQNWGIIRHDEASWMDSLCLDCIKKDPRFKVSV